MQLTGVPFLGTPYVELDDTVTVWGYDHARSLVTLVQVTPTSSPQLNVKASVPRANSPNGFPVIKDARGGYSMTAYGVFFVADGGTETQSGIYGPYSLVTPTSVLTLRNDRKLHSTCFDGSNDLVLATGLVDEYGLALGVGGALYVGQGNTRPSTVFRISPDAGVSAVTTLPMSVYALAPDPSGQFVYATGSAGKTVWRIDVSEGPSYGSKVVFGCDPSQPYHCGDTQKVEQTPAIAAAVSRPTSSAPRLLNDRHLKIDPQARASLGPLAQARNGPAQGPRSPMPISIERVAGTAECRVARGQVRLSWSREAH